MDRQKSDIRDVDGYGYPEIVSSDSEDAMTVRRSTIARTNKLKSVRNPLGGAFTLDYTRTQATYDHPGGKWVMKSVETDDGLADDGANMKTVFEYESGKHDRHEREFLGFGNAAFDHVAPTQTEYDILDRAVKTTLPDGTVSTTNYTKNAADGTLITTVTDGEGGQQATFTNGSGLTVKTEQYSGPDGTITTRFEFDPINQLLKAIDNGGNETVSMYDMAGRRTEVTHPASGRTGFVYDNAGNLLSKQTASLEEEGKAITYDYEFNRLTAITYPNHPENNVRYTYGNKNAPYNRVGRLMLQEDGSGAQEFTYDRLGNIESVRRTLIIPNQAIATYLTKWKYDSWNRVEEMIYPDGEKITYTYNAGGLLQGVKGEKAYSYNYVNHLGYDKFEQRVYMKYCNGAETAYSYDEQRR
ncbi:MAG: hypothetical protein LBV26_07055, partial [Bacteroidales bacterium]|nr:hypothetical protein [Bacteroidales bacterium]